MGEVERRKPTEMAKMYFSYAANTAFPGIQAGMNNKVQADVLHKIAAGLEEMATGLRATYILLSEVRDLLKQQQKKS